MGSNQICEQACSRIGLSGSGVWRDRPARQLAGDAVKAELGGERQADRTAADDQNGNSAGHGIN
jgi:hypothetical protein